MKKTVFAIGASGFIGLHAIRKLAACDHIVYATHLPSERPESIPGVHWISCDLTKIDATNHWPPCCDSLIFMAQSPSWRLFPERAEDVFQVNVAGVFRAAEYACHVQASRIIFLSTGSVYTQTNKPSRESHLFNLNVPLPFYYASKLSAELLLKAYDSIFSTIVLRLFVPFGAGQHPDMLLPQLVQRVREHKPIDLHGNDGMLINPVAVVDIAEVIVRCLEIENSVTLNVAGPEALNLREIGLIIGRFLNIEPVFQTHPDQKPPVLVGDTRALRDTIGWVPKTTFEYGLRIWLGEGI